jgi:hypothetical protein
MVLILVFVGLTILFGALCCLGESIKPHKDSWDPNEAVIKTIPCSPTLTAISGIRK